MGTRVTVDQLEKMTTHELAELLENVVLVMRRMPDVVCSTIVQQIPREEKQEKPQAKRVVKAEKHATKVVEHATGEAAPLTREALSKRNMTELKALATEMNVLYLSGIRKDDLISKILARPLNGHSEQRAIQDM